jgi:leucyl-tRNA synthetase
VAVPDDQLPVLLPDDVDFRPGGESPLARHEGFVNTVCPIGGERATRDTDTMDTFVDSAWYYYRYCSPHAETQPFEAAAVERWMPVDQYIGGVEHAILHLLYCRFLTKVLFDMGMVGFTEPMLRLMNQGQVIFGGASMSKSKGNIVEPMPLVERWGADTMRLNILFAGPFEDDVDWKLIAPDPHRRPGVTTWLGRVFAASAGAASGRPDPEPLRRLTHRTIRDVTDDMERFRFNVAISKLQVLSNAMRSALDAGEGAREAAAALTLMLAPLAPSRRRSSGARCSATPRACTQRTGRPSTRRWRARSWSRWWSRSTGRSATGSRSGPTPTRRPAEAGPRLGEGTARDRGARARPGDRPGAPPGEPGHLPLGTPGHALNIRRSRPDRKVEAGVGLLPPDRGHR